MKAYIDILDANYIEVTFDERVYAYDMSKFFAHKLDLEQLKHNPKYRYGKWNGEIRYYNAKTGKIYLGLLSQVSKYLRDRMFDIVLTKRMDRYVQLFEEPDPDLSCYESVFQLRGYQKNTVIECLSMKRRLIQSPTSSGKTFMIYCIVEELKRRGIRSLILVPNKSLVSQMGGSCKKIGDFEEYGGNPDDYHLIYDGAEKYTDAPIVISTWQSLQSLLKDDPEYFEQFGCVIADEAHQATANVMVKLVEACIMAYYRFGFSGTYYKPKTDILTLNGLFGPKYIAITTREMIDAGYVPNLQIGVLGIRYTEKDRRFMKGSDYATEMEFIETHIHRNKIVVDIAMQLKGNTLCLFRKHEHGHLLKNIADNSNRFSKKVYMLTGNDSDEVRKEVINIMEKETNVLVFATYGIFSTGISVKNLNNVILGSDMLSFNKVAQSIGRALRKFAGKNDVFIYDIMDDISVKYAKSGRKLSAPYLNYAYQHGFERLDLYEMEEFEVHFKNLKLEYSYEEEVEYDSTRN